MTGVTPGQNLAHEMTAFVRFLNHIYSNRMAEDDTFAEAVAVFVDEIRPWVAARALEEAADEWARLEAIGEKPGSQSTEEELADYATWSAFTRIAPDAWNQLIDFPGWLKARALSVRLGVRRYD